MVEKILLYPKIRIQLVCVGVNKKPRAKSHEKANKKCLLILLKNLSKTKCLLGDRDCDANCLKKYQGQVS
jgi:hypothetical protein